MKRTMLCLLASAAMACGTHVSTNATTTTAAKMEARTNGRAPLPPPSPPPTMGQRPGEGIQPLPELGGPTPLPPSNTVQSRVVVQSGDRADIHITARIRSAVLDDDSLSDAAKHVRIVTRGRRVLLTGAVPTARERDDIDAKARNFPGVLDVEDDVVVGLVR
ncbi:MAG TPA: BON domain-containing protein [Polyangiaceae bacterium]|jgi:hypothetical protein